MIPEPYTSPYLSIGWFSFAYPMYALLVGGIIFLCFDVKPISVLFYVSVGYALQNCAFQSYSLVTLIINMSGGTLPNYASVLIGLAVYGIVYTAGYFALIKRFEHIFYERMYVRISIVSASIVIIVYVLDMWLRTNNYMNLGVLIYSILTDVLLIGAQAGIFRESRYEREQMILTQLLRQEMKQKELGEKNASLLSIKYHDLKYLLNNIRGNGDENVEEIDRVLGIYDSFVKSGNDVLDVVLTEKSLLCKQNGIKLSVIADGQAVSFMGNSDVSVLFGNILDNAIEALMKVDEGERTVSINVSRQKGFVIIHEDNRCIDAVEFENGLPKTTKESEDFHGFGTKSIKLIAEKYGGSVNMRCEDEMFSIEIIIPIPA